MCSCKVCIYSDTITHREWLFAHYCSQTLGTQILQGCSKLRVLIYKDNEGTAKTSQLNFRLSFPTSSLDCQVREVTF